MSLAEGPAAAAHARDGAPSPGSIAVIIPCWNGAAWVGDAIASALGQDGVSPEVLVIDDGSTDDSLAVIGSFGDRVRCLTGPNLGVSAARNRGVAETASEWVVFLDADDLLLPGTLAERLAAAEAAGADVVICDWREFAGTAEALTAGPLRSVDMDALDDDAELACATHVWATTAALMYRRPIVEAIGGFREDLPVIQDARFLFDAARSGARFVRSPHVGARYRVQPRSLSKRDPARFWRDALRNGMQIEAIWTEGGVLGPERRRALCDIYNGAAHALFRAEAPEFYEAVARLRSAGLGLTMRNRLALVLCGALGVGRAAKLANLWTRLRHGAGFRMSARA